MIVINIGCLIALFILYIIGKKKEIKLEVEPDKKEHPFRSLYGPILFYLTIFSKKFKRSFGEKTKEAMGMLYVGDKKKSKEMALLHSLKKISIVVIVLAVVQMVCLFVGIEQIKSKNQKIVLERQEVGESTNEYELKVKVKDETRPVSITVNPQTYTEKEYQEKLKEAKAYISKMMLGENESYECITTKLICPSSIPDSAISVQYFSQNYDLIEDDGTIHNQSLTKEEVSSIIVQYRYGDKMEEEEIPMVIFPRKLSKEGKMVQAVKEKLKKLEQDSIHSPVVVIPKTIEQCGILLAQEEKSNVLLLFFGGLFIAGLLYMQQEEALKKQVKQRNDQLLRDYPELVNKLVLLLGAGMTMKGAITKMAMDYKKKREQSGKIKYLYEEMLVMMYEFQSGGSELQVYYNFGRRIKLAPYLKFTTLILQNLKKGAKDLTHMLEQEELVAFAGRKERAKVLGEEAGSKLLLPMMLILIMIIIMIMFPALSSFSI